MSATLGRSVAEMLKVPRFAAYGADQDLYFIQNAATTLVKIGVSWNPSRRRDKLQCASGSPITLRHVIRCAGSIERDLHDQFADERACGEWFRPTGLLSQMVDAHTDDLEALLYRCDATGIWSERDMMNELSMCARVRAAIRSFQHVPWVQQVRWA